MGMFANLIVDFFIPKVRLCSEPSGIAGLQDYFGIFVRIIGYSCNYDLNWRQPDWQLASVMLQKDAGKSLQRTKQRPMQHDRWVFIAIRTNIKSFQPFRKIKVYLQRTTLPVTADSVTKYKFQFWAIEGAFTRISGI